jgi:hypothetical protein
MTEDPQAGADFNVDRSNLYREETFTDLKVGTIKRLIPVRPDGSEDKSRRVMFVGQSSLMTPHGPVPIQNVIPGKELQQAIKKFPEAMQAAMDRLVEEAQKYQETQQHQEDSTIQKPDSRIIVPGR